MDVSKQDIYDFIKKHPEKPWHLQELQKRLNVKNRNPLRLAMGELVEEGKLIRTRRRSYGLPQEMNLMVGRLQITSGGYGFVIPDEGDAKDLFIPADNLAGAWNNDRVVARPDPNKRDNGRVSGEIVRILERRNPRVVGSLEYSRGYAILRPDSPRLRERILLLPDSVGKLEPGSRIVVKMVWPEDSGERDPFGEIEEVLGDEATPANETRAVIIKYGLKDDFDAETIAEAEAVPPVVSGDMLEGRTDIRGINTFTIDGEDAKDFDDAISLERLSGKGKKGLLRVGIHIADVSYYVAEGTSLDREAKERATSVYMPGQVLPMLPEQLSNGICSLVEGEARLALSAFVDISREGEVDAFRFKETIIESDARLTYGQVREFAEGGRLPKGKRKLERDIKVLLTLTQGLREKRLANGALDFNFTEAKVDVDADGEMNLVPIRSNLARQLIEELMLLANKLVAKELSSRDIPALYRVHEDPSEDKLTTLQRGLQRLGYNIDTKDIGPDDLQNVLKEVAGKPEQQLVNTLLLRSLKQARYSAENLGHFGLAFENYLHFTSPIRRYPDLVVHRVLRALLQHRLSPTLKERMKSDFPALGEHTSERERNAEDAERDLTRYYHAAWARDHIGETFSAAISGVTNFGIFTALSNGVEGLIHVSQLEDDYYMYLEDSLMLLGKNTRKKFRLGDKLDVKIYQANPVQRQIDLIPGYMDLPATEDEEDVVLEQAPRRLKTPLSTQKSHPREDERAEQNAGERVRAENSRSRRSAPPVQVEPSKTESVEAKAPDNAKPEDKRRRSSQPAQKTEAKASKAPARKRSGKKRVLIFGDPNRKR